jgi:ACS family tartrate transporter-like MFS transporter
LAVAVLIKTPLDRARRKVYARVLPILFACYVIAYIDRINVSLAKLPMSRDLPAFNNDVIGAGAGLFFIGYFLLEIPGTLLVEKWSARKWICRIMITWGIVAACTAWAKTPTEFYAARFGLGLAEAGFFPGAIVYLTHWFAGRDRTRALSWFIIGSPVAQIISPRISNYLLGLGTLANPGPLGLAGWQWLYVAWGIPAVVLGVIVLWKMPDHPNEATWLDEQEKLALNAALDAEKQLARAGGRTTMLAAMRHPTVLLLALAYFCIQSGNYGIDIFMPSILARWYSLDLNATTWLIMLPAGFALAVTLFIGWNSDRTKERRLHAAVLGFLGGIALAAAPHTQGHLAATMLCMIVAGAALKAYMAPFWALPNLFLTESAAAGSIGLINSIGNLGGYFGPRIVGHIDYITGSFVAGIDCLGGLMIAFSVIILLVGWGVKRRERQRRSAAI